MHDLVERGRVVRLPVELEQQGQVIGALRLTEHSDFSRRLVKSLVRLYRQAGIDKRPRSSNGS